MRAGRLRVLGCSTKAAPGVVPAPLPPGHWSLRSARALKGPVWRLRVRRAYVIDMAPHCFEMSASLLRDGGEALARLVSDGACRRLHLAVSFRVRSQGATGAGRPWFHPV